jgi:hypothetical protein
VSPPRALGSSSPPFSGLGRPHGATLWRSGRVRLGVHFWGPGAACGSRPTAAEDGSWWDAGLVGQASDVGAGRCLRMRARQRWWLAASAARAVA